MLNEKRMLARQLNQDDDMEGEVEEEVEEEMPSEEDEPSESQSVNSIEKNDIIGTRPEDITNKMIRDQLEQAIREAREDCDKFEAENLLLQARIVALNRDKKKSNDRTSEFNMSDVKYANTLARVH